MSRPTREDELREHHDTQYWKNGPCCAGCDWWHSLNSNLGECHRSAPIPGPDRLVMAGIENCTLLIGGGHALTTALHNCGDFKDDFDWSSLPYHYRRRIGCPDAKGE